MASKFLQLMKKKSDDLYNRPITVAFLGDSVTQGCYELYLTSPETLQTFFDSENSYSAKFRKIMSVLYPMVPLTVINSGISGDRAVCGLERLDRDILSFKPDLVIVCYGLNDCASNDGKEVYANTLKQIFNKIKESGAEVIYMTPNFFNTEVSCHLKEDLYKGLAPNFAKLQNDGTFDEYVEAGRKAAKESNTVICDVYSKWKQLEANGVCITDLLSNYLNHPTRDMHWLFAFSLAETLFSM